MVVAAAIRTTLVPVLVPVLVLLLVPLPEAEVEAASWTVEVQVAVALAEALLRHRLRVAAVVVAAAAAAAAAAMANELQWNLVLEVAATLPPKVHLRLKTVRVAGSEPMKTSLLLQVRHPPSGESRN